MSDDKISGNKAINAALHLDGDPQNVKAYYEDWSKNYNIDISSAEYAGPRIAASLLQRHLPDKDACVLDAGCGTGLVGVELARLGYSNIDGFDLAESMARQAIATASYRQVLAGIDMMRATESYADESYDAILSVGVFTLGHVPPEAMLVLLKLARPDGLLLLSTRSHYYDQTNFQQLVDDLVADRQIILLQLLGNAPYNKDGDGHYWVFKRPV